MLTFVLFWVVNIWGCLMVIGTVGFELYLTTATLFIHILTVLFVSATQDGTVIQSNG